MTSSFNADKLTETIIHIAEQKRPQTVKELIALVQENAPWSHKEILDAVLKLQDEAKIGLVSSSLSVPLRFSAYLRTKKVLWYWVIVTIAMLSVVFSILIKEDFYPWNYFRNVLGLMFVLWLPGYTFLRVIFPVNAPKTEISTNLSNEERIALSVIMSLALIALIGLLLDFSPWGITSTTIVLSLLSFSLILSHYCNRKRLHFDSKSETELITLNCFVSQLLSHSRFISKSIFTEIFISLGYSI